LAVDESDEFTHRAWIGIYEACRDQIGLRRVLRRAVVVHAEAGRIHDGKTIIPPGPQARVSGQLLGEDLQMAKNLRRDRRARRDLIARFRHQPSEENNEDRDVRETGLKRRRPR